MNEEQKRGYVQKLMTDVQKARSIFYEASGGDTAHEREVADSVGGIAEPWLFGRQCVLPTLIKALEGEIDDTLVVNLSTIAQHSAMLGVIGVTSKRHDPTIEEVFAHD